MADMPTFLGSVISDPNFNISFDSYCASDIYEPSTVKFPFNMTSGPGLKVGRPSPVNFYKICKI